MARRAVVAMAASVLVAFLLIMASASLWFFVPQASALMAGPPKAPPRLGTVVAVDLGNTKSCVAGYHRAAGKTAPFRVCIPTSVAFADDGGVLVGEAARGHAGAVSGFKRLLGKRLDHADVHRAAAHLPYTIADRDARIHVEVKNPGNGEAATKLVGVEEVAAAVVAELKARAEAHLGGKVHDAVVTVPRYFIDAPRRAAMDAATMAGLTTVRILDEPAAAAVAHGLHRKLPDGGNVLVLHVGGGTSDATVLTYENGVFDTVGSWHDLHLGGDSFDQRLVDHFARLLKENHGVDVAADEAALADLRTQCELAKKTLRSHSVAQVNLELPNNGGVGFSGSLTRAEFEELNADLFQEVIAVVEKAMRGSELAEEKEIVIDEVVLVGGSSRIPRIRELVKNYFHGKEAVSNGGVEPDEAVVHGGALLSRPMADGYQCMGGDRRQLGASTDWCYQY